MCVFCKIINGEIPSEKVFENGDMIIIKDINPQAPKHFLLIPKQHYADIGEMTVEQSVILARCLKTFSGITDSVLGLSGGYRLISNKGGDACQSVPHLHIHILGGKQLSDKMG